MTDGQQLTRLGAHTHWGVPTHGGFIKAMIDGSELIDDRNITLKFKKESILIIDKSNQTITYNDEDLLQW